jgi:hypothetical protein
MMKISFINFLKILYMVFAHCITGMKISEVNITQFTCSPSV